MTNKLIKFGLIIMCNAICLPLAYLGVTHGSSFGLETAVFMVVLCITFNVVIIKAD